MYSGVHACACACVYVHACVHVCAHMRRPEADVGCLTLHLSILFNNLKNMCLFIYLYVFTCSHIYSHVLMSEDKLQGLTSSFHHIGPRDWTQVFTVGSKCLHLLRYLHWPSTVFFETESFFSWTWRSLLQLDWHTGRCQGYFCLCLLNTGDWTQLKSSLLCPRHFANWAIPPAPELRFLCPELESEAVESREGNVMHSGNVRCCLVLGDGMLCNPGWADFLRFLPERTLITLERDRNAKSQSYLDWWFYWVEVRPRKQFYVLSGSSDSRLKLEHTGQDEWHALLLLKFSSWVVISTHGKVTG